MKNTECNKNNIRELYVNLMVEAMIHYTPTKLCRSLSQKLLVNHIL
mgnify:CR=1 FL=1